MSTMNMTDASEVNRTYFNAEASHYEAKHEKSLRQLSESLLTQLGFIGVGWLKDEESDEEDEPDKSSSGESGRAGSRQLRLLDYACGTGMISRTFAQFTTQCVGIDISENMVSFYNARAQAQGLLDTEMKAFVGDLSNRRDPHPPSFAGPEFFNFDAAAVGGGFHHFADPELAAARLVERLRPGGVLFIWDFLEHGAFSSDHPAANSITHHGFSKERMQRIFEAAGAGTGFQLVELGNGIVGGGSEDIHGEILKRTVFLARGAKAMEQS